MRLREAMWRGIVCGMALAGTVAATAQERAQSADAFVDSIGVCTHWTYPDTPYGQQYEKVRQLLAASGIRHVRDGWNPRMEDLARLGIRTTLVTDPGPETPQQIQEKIKALSARLASALPGRTNPVIDAVEGPNEPDLFWVNFKKSYRGQGFEQGIPGIIAGVTAFQKDLYTALKGDPATAKIRVIGPALGKTYDPGGGSPNPFAKGSLTDYVDYGNFHPYPGGNPFSFPFPYATIEKYYWQGNMPSGNIDEFPYAFNTYGPTFAPKPMAATETGYATDTGGVADDVHALYMPRLFCEYFRKGIAHTYSYEFVDEFARPGDREACFGLLRHDLTPKPAYTVLKNLISLLQDKNVPANFQPGTLDYRLAVSPAPGYDKTQFMHHLLLQKSGGDFYLLLWHEIADEDTSKTPHRRIHPPALPVTLRFIGQIARTVVYSPNDSLTPIQSQSGGGMVQLDVPDKVTIVQITPGKLRL